MTAWGHDPRAFEVAVDRLTAVGYRVELRASGAELRDGRRIAALYDVVGNGSASLVRDDDLACLEFLGSEAEVEARRACLAARPDVPRVVDLPTLVGPLDLGSQSRDRPQMGTTYDLAGPGYREAEYVVSGRAARYLVAEDAPARRLSTGHEYTTRLLARAPVSPEMFRGTVVVEWLNVSSTANVDQLWLECGEDLMRHGFAYVGVSVQRVGVHGPRLGLREWSPIRYGAMDLSDSGTIHDDSLGFDVFAQVGHAVRLHGLRDLVPPHRVRRLLASGSSQSCKMLCTFHNGLDRSVDPYDAHLLALGLGDRVRPQAGARVLKLNSETDVMMREAAARQADSETLCTWEVAGSSHISCQMERARREIVARGDLPAIAVELAAEPPFATIPWGRCAIAGLLHLERWVDDGIAPPAGDLLETIAITASSAQLARDVDGNALGGVRLPGHEVPVARNQGLNHGPGRADLWGVHVPFADSRLRELYTSVDEFRRQTSVAEARCVQHGFAAANSVHDQAESDAELVRLALGGR